jgi:hypothetical protein
MDTSLWWCRWPERNSTHVALFVALFRNEIEQARGALKPKPSCTRRGTLGKGFRRSWSEMVIDNIPTVILFDIYPAGPTMRVEMLLTPGSLHRVMMAPRRAVFAL